MTFLLSSQNIFEYLSQRGLCTLKEQTTSKIEQKPAKNFNLLLSRASGKKLLVKQERWRQDKKTPSELLREWHIREFLQQFPEIGHLRAWLPEVLFCDVDNIILVFDYLDDYQDLLQFYTKENTFPIEIAASIGEMLATVHRLTLKRQEYREFLRSEESGSSQALNVASDLDRLTPEVFGEVPPEGLKFFGLYQRYESLGAAISELEQSIVPCCLTHDDFKLNNILLPLDWEHGLTTATSARSRTLKLIDWERANWGDPAFDLGMMIASYLQIWLNSLIASKAMSIEESLRLATTPLELIQPSLAALVGTYFENFPEIIDYRPDYLRRVIQFSGLALIQAIRATLQHQKFFGNTGICMLQVAKSLLCRPEASVPTIFGVAASELTPHYSPA